MTRLVLIAGGAGFIAGNLTHHWCKAHSEDPLVVLDALTYWGNRATIQPLIAPQHGVRLSQSQGRQLITSVADRPGHERRYAIDASKMEVELGWCLQVSVQEGLRRTVEWCLTNQAWWQPLLAQGGGV
jgi:dTDP-D-glucose 4,6-dehydratase